MGKPSVAVTLAVIVLWLWCLPSLAQETMQGLQEIDADADCFACHGDRKLAKELQGGRKITLWIDKDRWQKSAHAQMGCSICHGERPHPPTDQVDTQADWQRFESQLSETCNGCHQAQSEAFNSSVHARSANPSAPGSCVECHDPHEAGLETRNKQDAVNICGRCHKTSRKTYYQSIHGQNLALGNQKVAVCLDCHGYHDVKRVDQAFAGGRLQKICSECHNNVPPNISGWYSHAPVTGVQRFILQATELFYIIIIPLTLLSMIAHQILRHRRTMEERRRARQEEQQ